MTPPRVRGLLRGLALALGLFALGLLVRSLFRSSLGSGLFWETFYPLVAVAALVGGPLAALELGLVTAVFAFVGWPLVSPPPMIADAQAVGGAGLFVGNAALIALLAGGALWRRGSEPELRDGAGASNGSSEVLSRMGPALQSSLHTLQGFTALLSEGPEATARQKELAAAVDRNARHLQSLVTDLLAEGQGETRAQGVASVPLAVHELVAGVVEELRPRAEARGVRLVSHTEPGVPRRMWVDGETLRQILVGLAGNAVAASDRGTVVVGLDWDAEGQTLKLGVETSSPSGGVDGGLASVRQWVERLRGEWESPSTPGEGARFVVRLPAAASREPNGHPVPLTLALPLAGHEGHRFLIVEGPGERRDLLVAVHRSLHQECRFAEEGDQTLAAVRQWNPELVWMDVRHPGFDAPGLVKKIRGMPEGRDVKVVAVADSGHHVGSSALQASGFDAVLSEPFPIARIPQLMHELLGLRFATAETEPEFARLSAEDRARLLEALESLDPERIDLSVHELQRRDPKLAAAIRLSIERLDYAGLRTRLRAVQNEAGG